MLTNYLKTKDDYRTIFVHSEEEDQEEKDKDKEGQQVKASTFIPKISGGDVSVKNLDSLFN